MNDTKKNNNDWWLKYEFYLVDFLSKEEFYIYHYLKSLKEKPSGVVRFTTKKISEDLKMSKRTIIKVLKFFKDIELIELVAEGVPFYDEKMRYSFPVYKFKDFLIIKRLKDKTEEFEKGNKRKSLRNFRNERIQGKINE